MDCRGLEFRIGRVELLGLDREKEKLLRSLMKPGELFTLNLYDDVLKRLKTRMPDDVSPADIEIRRNVRDSTVDLIFDFRTCPKPEG